MASTKGRTRSSTQSEQDPEETKYPEETSDSEQDSEDSSGSEQDSEETSDNEQDLEDKQDPEDISDSEQNAKATSVNLDKLRFRGQPRATHELYNQMQPKQKSAIRQTDLCGTLDLGMKESLPSSLVKKLIKLVDPINKTLKLGKGDNAVVIGLQKAVPKVFLLRDKGKTVPLRSFAGGRKGGKKQDIGSDLNHLEKKSKKSKVLKADYLRKIQDCTNSRKVTCRIYKNAIFSTLLTPNTGVYIERRISNMLANLEEWNWPEFIVDYLLKSIKEVLEGHATCLVGCPALLMVICLDMIRDDQQGKPSISEGFPRAKHLKDVHVNWLKKQDFDELKFKNLSESVYGEDASFDIEKELQGLRGEDVAFDDDADDEKDNGDTSEEDDKEPLFSDLAAQSTHSMKEKLKETLDSIPVTDVQDFKTRMTNLEVDYSAKLNNAAGMPSDSNEKGAIQKILHDLSSALLELATSYVQSHNANMLALVNQWIQCLEHVTELKKPTCDFIEQVKVQKRGRKRQCSKMVNNFNTTKGEVQGVLKRGKRRSLDLVLIDDTQKESTTQQYRYPATLIRPDGIHSANFPLTCVDLECLITDDFVTDSILHLYSHHLQGKLPLLSIIPPDIGNKYYICDPFVWGQLKDCKSADDYKELETSWFDHVNLSDLKFLFIIVGGSNHWSLLTIYWPRYEATSKRCYILHMDSLGNFHDAADIFTRAKMLLKYALSIDAEFITKKVQVPHQGLTNDCALFTLYSMQKLIMNINAFGEKDCHEDQRDWYAPNEASALRKEIKTLIETHKLKALEKECRNCVGNTHALLQKKFRDAFS